LRVDYQLQRIAARQILTSNFEIPNKRSVRGFTCAPATITKVSLALQSPFCVVLWMDIVDN
jgi:hypothetical protein